MRVAMLPSLPSSEEASIVIVAGIIANLHRKGKLVDFPRRQMVSSEKLQRSICMLYLATATAVRGSPFEMPIVHADLRDENHTWYLHFRTILSNRMPRIAYFLPFYHFYLEILTSKCAHSAWIRVLCSVPEPIPEQRMRYFMKRNISMRIDTLIPPCNVRILNQQAQRHLHTRETARARYLRKLRVQTVLP